MMKKQRIIAVFLGFSLLFTACGQQIGIGNGDSGGGTSWQEYFDIGMRFLSEGNYEEAIIAFTAAIEIDPKIPEAYFSRGDAYVGAAKLAYTGPNGTPSLSEEAISMCKSAIADYLLVIDLDTTISDAYLKAAEVYVYLNETDAAIDVLERGVMATGDQSIQNYLCVLQAGGRDELLRPLLTLLSQNNLEGAIALMRTDAYVAMSALQTDGFYSYTEDNAQYIAVYPNDYYYFGSMEEGQRSGHGRWLCAYFDGDSSMENYLFEGEWEDDLPNGLGTLILNFKEERSAPEGSIFSIQTSITGGFHNGLYHGTFNETWKMNSGITMVWSPIIAIDGVYQPYPGEIPAQIYNEEFYNNNIAQGNYIVAFTADGADLWNDGKPQCISGLGLLP